MADSVDPHADSVFIAGMRHYSDSIRKAESRPVVALVLSGGGAKGAAELGVIKALEELDFPIDMICGTSIGGLIGGLLSLGYDSDFIAELFRTSDWDEILYDYIDPSYIPYETKMYESAHQLHFPFQHKFNIGADAGRSNAGASSLSASLPSGFTYGLHINSLISSLSVGYLDSLDFKDLPIPFFCVASEMVSCNEKNWGSGEIRTAMRSTMSIPGLYDPVRIGDMVLTDGGNRNNFPADLARAMGADIVIGISVASENDESKPVQNIGHILSQMMNMLSNESFERTVALADIFIRPDTDGYNMLSFNSEAIDTLFARGKSAAEENMGRLTELREMVASGSLKLQAEKAVNIAETPVLIDVVEFTGTSDRDEGMLHKLTGISPGSRVDKDIMDDAVTKLYALGAFSEISYKLSGKEEPYHLSFDCKPAPANRAGAGLRVDTEEWAALLLDVEFNAYKLSGSKFGAGVKLGQNAAAKMKYSYTGRSVKINAEAGIGRVAGNLWLDGTKMRFDYFRHQEKIYFSNIRLTNFDIQAGIRNRYYNISDVNSVLGAFIQEIYGEQARTGNYTGAFLSADLYSMDDRYYPLKGVRFNVGYGYDFAKAGYREFKGIHEMSLDFKGVIPVGKFSIIPDLHLRSIIGSDFSLAHENFIGGDMAGRYLDQQIPFIGFGDAVAAENNTAVLNLEFRYNPVRNLFFSAIGGYAKTEDTIGGMVENLKPTYYGFGVEAAYNTIAGPVKANVHWSDMTHTVGFIISLGLDF